MTRTHDADTARRLREDQARLAAAAVALGRSAAGAGYAGQRGQYTEFSPAGLPDSVSMQLDQVPPGYATSPSPPPPDISSTAPTGITNPARSAPASSPSSPGTEGVDITESIRAGSGPGDRQPRAGRGGLVEVGDDLPVEQQDLVLPVQRDPLRRHARRHRTLPHRHHNPGLHTHTTDNDPPPGTLSEDAATSTTLDSEGAELDTTTAAGSSGAEEAEAMDEQVAGLMVAELAILAGRNVDAYEVAAVIALPQEMPVHRANDIWRRHHNAPTRVSLRDYLAMVLRFINQGPPPGP